MSYLSSENAQFPLFEGVYFWQLNSWQVRISDVEDSANYNDFIICKFVPSITFQEHNSQEFSSNLWSRRSYAIPKDLFAECFQVIKIYMKMIQFKVTIRRCLRYRLIRIKLSGFTYS